MDAAEIFARLLEPDGRADPYPLYKRLHATTSPPWRPSGAPIRATT